MKKLLSIILCLLIAMSFAGCGKKDETKTSPDVKQSEKVKAESEKNSEEKADASEEKSDDSAEGSGSETTVLPQTSASEIESKIDEFNTTDDPERKEELRKDLEEFLKQAEEMANQG